MTRVILLANNVEELGGVQRVLRVIGDGLASRGHDVVIAGLVPHKEPHDHELGSAPVRTLSESRDPRGISDGLSRLLAEGEPGVIVTAQVWAMEQLRRIPHGGWRVIGQYHSSYEAAARGRDLARILTEYRDVDAFLALAPEDARNFSRHGLRNVGWLRNPVAVWPAAMSGTAHTVTFLGRLAPEKGPRFLIEAWREVASQHPEWRLRMVGHGPQADELRMLAAGLGIEFEPAVSDVSPVLAGTGILALPSLVEGLPLSLMEAMAAGLPTVAADCSAGVRMLAAGGRGALVRRGDAQALASALHALMEDEGARSAMGAAAREAMAAYRLDPVLDDWEQLLVDVQR